MSIILNGTTGITAPAGTLNRSGDGNIITLEKDGVYKGLIGINGNDPYFGRRAGVGITAQNNKIRPADGDDGSGYDNAVDLGEPTYRFKDLYLSGGVYVGGTSSANKLDDYEEGTWTPAVTFGGNSVGQTGTFAGFYTKTGNQVFATALIGLGAKGSSTGTVGIGGLPFTSNSNSNYRATSTSVLWENLATAYVNMLGLLSFSSTNIEILAITAASFTSATNPTQAAINNNTNFRISITYQV